MIYFYVLFKPFRKLREVEELDGVNAELYEDL